MTFVMVAFVMENFWRNVQFFARCFQWLQPLAKLCTKAQRKCHSHPLDYVRQYVVLRILDCVYVQYAILSRKLHPDQILQLMVIYKSAFYAVQCSAIVKNFRIIVYKIDLWIKSSAFCLLCAPFIYTHAHKKQQIILLS